MYSLLFLLGGCQAEVTHPRGTGLHRQANPKLPMVFVSQSCGGAGSSPTHLRDCGLKHSLLHTIEGY